MGGEGEEKERKLAGWGFIYAGSGSAQTTSAIYFHLETPAVCARDDRGAEAAVCDKL